MPNLSEGGPEARTEGSPSPEERRIYELTEAYSVLATWLGMTPTEVEEGLKLTQINAENPPTALCINTIKRGPGYFGAICEITDKDDFVIATKIVGYSKKTGGVTIANTSPRLA